MAEQLPTDIIINILSKLPVKSLVRFQCVCKSWQSIIKTPSFIKTHLNQTLISDNSDHRHLLVLVDHTYFFTSELDLHNNQLSFSFSELRHPLKTGEPFIWVGCCNGVVCISNFNKTNLFLFNPLTNSQFQLPRNNIPIPDLNVTVFGFGYDFENDDYKVLSIVQGLGKIDDRNKAQVYSLKTNSWKCIIQGMPYKLYYGYYDGFLVNEALHYVVSQEVNSECLGIVKFDLRTDTFSLLRCPNDGKFENTSFGNTVFNLTELGGCLCLLINYYSSDLLDEEFLPEDEFDTDVEFDRRELDHVDLWVMNEYGNESSWVRLFSIRQPEDIGSYKFIRTIVYSKDGKRILMEIDNLGYCWYDLESKNVERTTTNGLPDEALRTGTFIGSVVSLGDKLQSGKKTLPKPKITKKKKKKDVDKFLSAGFKLKL